MKNNKFSQVGYSLPELLVVLAILGVLTTLAVAVFSRQKIQLQRQEAARQLKVYLERAKFDSIKRRAESPGEMANVTITSSYSFYLTSDSDQNGVLDADEVRRVNLPQNGGVKIFANSTVFPISIKFDFRGQVTATDGSNAAINPQFIFCDSGGTAANANAENSSVIAVSPSGTVTFTGGGKSQPPPVQANFTNTNAAPRMNQSGTVNN